MSRRETAHDRLPAWLSPACWTGSPSSIWSTDPLDFRFAIDCSQAPQSSPRWQHQSVELAMTQDQMQDHLQRANDAVDDHDVALAVRLLIEVVQALIPRGREPSP
jgi:hypothetical protein